MAPPPPRSSHSEPFGFAQGKVREESSHFGLEFNYKDPSPALRDQDDVPGVALQKPHKLDMPRSRSAGRDASGKIVDVAWKNRQSVGTLIIHKNCSANLTEVKSE